MQPLRTEQTYLTVTELNQLMNRALESQFPVVPLMAEIAEFTRASSGHLYLSLKDEKSQVSAVMWRGTAQGLGFRPEEGMSVVCTGRPNVYHVSGRLQLVLSQMQPAGEGLLRKKFLELKAKLEQEGLFSPDRKRALPFLPRAIGVVTSKTGAVIHDMMVKFQERMPSVPVFLYDVRVQGEGAAREIADGVRYFSESGGVDVVIVARGGGSLEDLWAFNEELVVRAVFASRVPVVSGVGHEVDVTLCDLAADVRAPTPTAAAEMTVPRRDELLRRIAELEARISAFSRWLEPWNQRVDELDISLKRVVSRLIDQARLSLARQEARLQSIQPIRLLEQLRGGLDMFAVRLQAAAGDTVKERRHRLERLTTKFEALNPQRVLERGFSIVEARGAVVQSPDQVQVGEKVQIRVSRGRIGATVTSTGKG